MVARAASADVRELPYGRVPVKYQQGDETETNTLSFCIESEITGEERKQEKLRPAEALTGFPHIPLADNLAPLPYMAGGAKLP